MEYSTINKQPHHNHRLDHQDQALDFIDFVNASPSPFHVVHEASTRLEKAGFERISEKDEWNLKRKEKENTISLVMARPLLRLLLVIIINTEKAGFLLWVLIRILLVWR